MGRKSFLNDKKAELQIALSAWWFFIIVVIGAGIVISASIYYATDIDIKWLEADVLGERVLDCMVDDGYFVEGISERVYNECGLQEDKFKKGSNYFFKIWVGDEMVLGGGDYSIEKNCEVKGEGIGVTKYFPICSEKKAIVWSEEGEEIKIRVLAGSNQQGRIESNI